MTTPDHPTATASPWRWRWAVLALLFALGTVGAARLAFLCDDAFITFRYVANAHAGHGLVWNPAPFAPVEGYTGFLWALLLWAAWSWFGIEPPQSANVLSGAFGALQFAVVAIAALRLRRRDGQRAGDAVALLALAVVVGNRSFLQWTTGGLETALFNFGFVAWVLLAFARDTRTLRWLVAFATTAAIAALTRPDGLLLVAATGAVALVARWRGLLTTRVVVAGLSPLLTVVAHVAWRRACYGDWLPNTYYAKVVDPWPEAGVRYLACFAIEHGTWLVAALAGIWLPFELWRGGRAAFAPLIRHPAAVAAVAACFVHAGYYVVAIGGDHFEYRVFSQFAPLLVLATAAMALRIAASPRFALLALGGLGLAGSVGWVHLALTRDLPPHGFQRLALRVPEPLQPLARWYDRQQAWLLFQNVGVRCQQHAHLLTVFREATPRRVHLDAAVDAFPVFVARGVGLVGWSLPDVAIIDHHGLNDWVVARTPIHGSGPALDAAFLAPVIDAADADRDGWFDEAEIRKALAMLGGGDGNNQPGDYLSAILLAVFAHERLDAMTRAEASHLSELLLHARAMAHERHPPPGYVEAFDPNVGLERGEVVVRPRSTPFTAERIRAIEREWRDKVRNGSLRR